MTYQEFKQTKELLNSQYDLATKAVNAFDWLNEKVRLSPEVVFLKEQLKKAHKDLREFNEKAPKEFKKKLQQERRAAWRK